MTSEHRGPRVAFVVVVLALLALTGAAPASADGAPVGADLHIAQTLGDRELTVVIRRAEPVPGPLRVELVTHTGTRPGPVTARTSFAGAVTSSAVITLGAAPGPYDGTLRVERPGAWELLLDDGDQVARIPFVVPALVASPWEKTTYGGFVAAGVLLLVSLGVALKRPRFALVPATGVVAAVAVAVTAALLSAQITPPPPPGAVLDPTEDTVADPFAVPPPSIVDFSRPPVNLLARAEAPGRLRVDVTDGSTGRPADDLLVHDNALVHLVIVSPAGRMWHLHPVRTAPGSYAVRLDVPETGDYAVSAELARRGGGVQLARTKLHLTATAAPTTAPAAPRPGIRQLGGTSVDLRTTPLTAGRTGTVTARFPTADLQPWLGMLGHLIVVGPLPDGPIDAVAAPVWAHAHAMTPVVPGAVGGQPDETVAAYGPDVAFSYTFPLPGRYRLWVQAERGYTVLTVPATVEVAAGNGENR
ncbi:hypothetical protein [Amycolatopsis sp. CA-230715]|uniref:hypothetical protein n=1 Tax=Amycolatopsis sp. CA-230715 TaxID=2745196 RepID=UPI001C02F4CD|nr:hypothetical protein [Amycolatopsis sp. CA-230715]QWF81286.1 hypothetical protein HUW46_04716 [Amycolatopsis sp. CA-230715]